MNYSKNGLVCVTAQYFLAPRQLNHNKDKPKKYRGFHLSESSAPATKSNSQAEAPKQRHQVQLGRAEPTPMLFEAHVRTGISLRFSRDCQFIFVPKAFYSNLITAQRLSSPI